MNINAFLGLTLGAFAPVLFAGHQHTTSPAPLAAPASMQMEVSIELRVLAIKDPSGVVKVGSNGLLVGLIGDQFTGEPDYGPFAIPKYDPSTPAVTVSGSALPKAVGTFTKSICMDGASDFGFFYKLWVNDEHIEISYRDPQAAKPTALRIADLEVGKSAEKFVPVGTKGAELAFLVKVTRTAGSCQ